ncbi:MAG: hypothetical protein JXP48_01295 [Acidobacteria bacterium]|nr:hypothetical protein [Acidobacteriota bacterium]
MTMLAGALGLAGVAAAFFLCERERFWINWVLWFLFLLTTGLGSLFLVALEHVVGARWSVPLRRVPETIAGLVPPMGAAALVGLLSLGTLYPWTSAEGLRDPLVAAKAGWLNEPFFALRAAACVLLWTVSYVVLVGGSRRQDQTGDPRFNRRARRFAPLFMVILGLTVTVTAFDWISSLEPVWYSDIFGVYVFAGAFLAGLAATTLFTLHLRDAGRLDGVGPDHLHNLGGFLFAFTVFWAYIGFAQYLLMWYANIPEEVFWYGERLHGAWGGILLALALLHFLVPFLILIPRDAKSRPRLLFGVALLMLAMHWLDLYWMLFPSVAGGPLFGWPELSFALLFLSGGIWWVRRLMDRGEAMPVGDPFLREGLEFRL